MVPRATKPGSSLAGALKYYLRDVGKDTSDRVEWTHTVNVLTDDPNKAVKVMAYTSMSAEELKIASGGSLSGRKAKRVAFAYSLSWHPNENPSREHMTETGLKSLKELGLQEHEAVIISHSDRPHKHIHVLTSLTHPTTGKVASTSFTHRKLSEFARRYQIENGMDYCPQREENHHKRLKGEPARHHDKRVQEAWNASDDGKSFAQALSDHGYALARGRKRLVVVDPYGRASNPTRLLDGVKAKEFRARISDIDHDSLPDADELSSQIERKRQEEKRLHSEDKKPGAASEFNEAAKGKPKLSSEFSQAAGNPKSKLAQDFQKAAAPEPKRKKEPEPSLQRGDEQKTEEPSSDGAPSSRDALLTPFEEFRSRIARLRAICREEEKSEKERLSKLYQLEKRKEEISNLRKRFEEASWWRKVLGLKRRDKAKLSRLKLEFDQARQAYRHKIATLRERFQKAEDALRAEFSARSKGIEPPKRNRRPPARSRRGPARSKRKGRKSDGGHQSHDLG